MRRRHPPRTLHRRTRFETYEEKLALSAHPVGELLPETQTDGSLEHHYGDLTPAEAVTPVGDFNLNPRLTKPTPGDGGPGNGGLGDIRTQLGAAHRVTGVHDVHDLYGFDGTGQTVAIIDSGIAYDHDALGGGIGASYRVVGGWDFAENDANPYDDGPAGFHGTHVAGIVGSEDLVNRGVAPGADLVALRVFDDNGAGYFSWVEDALQWVHDNRHAFQNPITTVNLSLGTNWNGDSIPDWATLEEELSQLHEDGIFVAVSAGNSFADFQTAGLSYPAASSHVVPVASVDDSGFFSSFSQRNERVLAAPGSDITSTVPDYIFGADGNLNDFGTASGTSMASPYVAGTAALVRQAMEFVGRTEITSETIYDHLRATADLFYDATTNASYHRINVQAALDELMPEDEFGSTVGTAHTLHVATGQTSVSGAIGTLGDVDYFSFVASETGTATVRVAARQHLVPEIKLVGSAATTSNVTTFDVVRGERYTFSLRSTEGLGHYDAHLTFEASDREVPDGSPPATQPVPGNPPPTEPAPTDPPTADPPFVGPQRPTSNPPPAAPAIPTLVLDASSLVNAATWNGVDDLVRNASQGGFVSDELVAVDVAESYQLSGWARAGNDAGGQFHQQNLQHFGFASYDVDGQVILPQHVSKVAGAADTRLAHTLRPGDTEIVLEDASGWRNGGGDHERSFAWYGYRDSNGHTYEDYTYTRNLKYKAAWDAGAIDYASNTIALSTPWEGPTVVAGTAVRNATSGGTYNYAGHVGSVANQWTYYEATIQGVDASNANSFRPGTAYIKPLVLTNYHGQAGNMIHWRDVQVRSDSEFTTGNRVSLSVDPLSLPRATYAWNQLSGPPVELLLANTTTATFVAPDTTEDVTLAFQLTVRADGATASQTLTIDVVGQVDPADLGVELDATTWGGEERLSHFQRYGVFTGDGLVPIDPGDSYHLSGWARSGDDAGGQYHANNLQLFGFASYDADGEIILPQHVARFEGAVDTRLAQPLRPGDTQIVLEDASGWNNGGADHQRSLAWYGYRDSTGHTYEDYTYTRNLKYKAAWEPGAVNYETNTITLATPWDGPFVAAGTAARNATSGGTYNYAGLVGSVTNEWTQYEATIQGVSSTDPNRFRPGTAYIKPLVLANYHGQDGNLVAWRDVQVRVDANVGLAGGLPLSAARPAISTNSPTQFTTAGPQRPDVVTRTLVGAFAATEPGHAPGSFSNRAAAAAATSVLGLADVNAQAAFRGDLVDAELQARFASPDDADFVMGPRRADAPADPAALPFEDDPSLELNALDQMFSQFDGPL